MGTKKRPAIDRFTEKVTPNDAGCHEWTADVSNSGYGRFWVEGKQKALAHRWSYEYHIGPIPDGLVIDHLCRNKLCVNPSHLEPVTYSENALRGVGPEMRSAIKFTATHCSQGHEFTPENTKYNGIKRVDRICVTCAKDGRKRQYESDKTGQQERTARWKAKDPERHKELGREAQRRYRARQRAKKEEAGK